MSQTQTNGAAAPQAALPLTAQAAAPAAPSLQQQAVAKALRFLDAAGATYTITLPDGGRWTNAPAMPAAKKPRVVVNDWVKLTGYVDKLNALQPGDVLRFGREDYPEFAGAGWGSFASSFHGKVKALFQPDTYILENRDGVVQVLRA